MAASLKRKTAMSKDPSFKTNTKGVNAAIDNTLNTINTQGQFTPPEQIQQFNPQDFYQAQQDAYNNVITQFDQTNGQAFDKQNADFQQMAAERGWDPTSKAYGDAYQMQVANPQNQARQAAATSAYQSGLAAQGQAYGQQANTYSTQLGAQQQNYGQAANSYTMPYQNLASLNPYYGQQNAYQMQQGQQGFTKGQNALDRNQAAYLANINGRYSNNNASISANGQIEVANINGTNAYLNNLNQYAQTPQYSFGNALASGVAQGVGAAIGGSLK